jgi:prefoldin subunit 5
MAMSQEEKLDDVCQQHDLLADDVKKIERTLRNIQDEIERLKRALTDLENKAGSRRSF